MTLPEARDRTPVQGISGAVPARAAWLSCWGGNVARRHDERGDRGRGGYTPFVRARQFAAVAAAARDRVDLGLRFTGPPASGRLQPSNGPGQATHKIALRSVAEVDDEVLHLVRLAYGQNG